MKRYEGKSTSVRDSFLAVAFDIYRNEERFWGFHALEEGKGEMCWQPVNDSLFSIPISLGNVVLKRAVTGPEAIEKATIIVEDEMITVAPEFDAGLYEDDLTRDMLERLRDTYYGHIHPRCFQVRREQIQAANQKIADQFKYDAAILSQAMRENFPQAG